MASTIFICIAVMFYFLAYDSHKTKSELKSASRELVEVLDREMKRKGAEGWQSVEAYLYRVTDAHHRYEIYGFFIAALGAIAEYILALPRVN